jgi:hypothetical protein
MFARGTPCLNGRKLSIFLDGVVNIPSDEPLLFLYPRWFTSAIRQKTSASMINAAKARNNYRESKYHLCRRLLHPLLASAISKRWLSATAPIESNAIASVDCSPTDSLLVSLHSNNSVEVRGDRGRRVDNGRSFGSGTGDMKSAPALSDGPSKTSTTISSLPLPEPAPDVRQVSDMLPLQRTPKSRRPLIFDRVRKEAQKLRYMDKAFPLVRRLSGRELIKLRYRKHTALWRRRNASKVPDVHWTNILHLLEQLSQDVPTWPKFIKHRIIHIPEETVTLLSGVVDMEENIWHMFILNGCRIWVLDATESEGPCRKVVLSGTERATELAEEAILQLYRRQVRRDPTISLQTPPVPIIPSITAMQQRGLPIPIIRGVWRVATPARNRFLPGGVPSLPFLSVRRFAEYVENLIQLHDDAQGRSVCSAQSTHMEQIKNIIEKLFTREANQKVVSTSALNMALSFLCDHEFLRSARLVLSKSEAVASANTYNILLRCAAKRQDLWVFRHILSSMSRFHVRPNGQTWIAFLHCLISPNVKERVMQHMLEKEYMTDPRTLEDALQLNISSMFTRHLDSERDVQSFIASMVKSYTPKFLSALSLNLMLEETVTRKDFDAMRQVVECFSQFQLSVDSRTLNQVFRFFRADIHKALLFLFRYIKLDRHPLDESNFEKLFFMASRKRSYNLCRVLWRYACMEGLTSWKMRQAMRTSLAWGALKSKDDSMADVWQRSAGKVIVGLEYYPTGDRWPKAIRRMVPSGYEDDPIAFLNEPTSSPEMRAAQQALAKTLVRQDVKEGKQFQPVEPLVLMLDAASILDRQWKAHFLSTSEMLRNIIHIPVEEKTPSSDRPFNQIPVR